MTHFIEKCKYCETIVNQCRCPDLKKEIRFCTCFHCMERISPSVVEQSEPETTTNIMVE